MPRSKLPKQDRETIVDSKLPIADLAKKYDVPLKYIYRIRHEIKLARRLEEGYKKLEQLGYKRK